VLPLLALVFTLSACGEKTAETSAAKPAEQAASAPATVIAAGGHPGQAIHDANCISCHDSGVYTRADRKMTNLEMLTGQVRRCDANLGTKLFDEDLDSVTAFLNETYYKFPK